MELQRFLIHWQTEITKRAITRRKDLHQLFILPLTCKESSDKVETLFPSGSNTSSLSDYVPSFV